MACTVEMKLNGGAWKAAPAPHTHDDLYAAIGHNHGAAYDVLGAADAALATALAADFSGSYTDLTNRPTLGEAASKNVGTAAGTVAAGDHTHPGGGSAPEYPVGWLLFSEVNVNPATFLGYGTWASYGAGRVLVGLDANDAAFNTAGGTGGAKTVAAAGTVSQPSLTMNALSGGLRKGGTSNPGSIIENGNVPTGTVSQPTFTGSQTSVVQPYIVVYMWRRTA
jgi:hypothetical protein